MRSKPPTDSLLTPCSSLLTALMKLVILDRDGVINYDSVHYIKSPAEWKPLPGSLEAIARLNQAGYRVVVATNQSGVGRGLFDMDTLNAIHEKMHRAVQAVGGRIDAIFYCPHAPDANCDCRKPRPGMFERIAACFNIDLARVHAIGDTLRDVEAAVAAGARPMLVRTGKEESRPADDQWPAGVPVFDDLSAAVDFIIQNKSGEAKPTKGER